MAFEGLTEKLTNAFNRLRGKGRLTESDVREAMREVKLALLEADVSFKVVKDFVNRVTERAVGTDVLKSLSPAQMVKRRTQPSLRVTSNVPADAPCWSPATSTVPLPSSSWK